MTYGASFQEKTFWATRPVQCTNGGILLKNCIKRIKNNYKKTLNVTALIVLGMVCLYGLLYHCDKFREEVCYRYYQMGWMLDKNRSAKMWSRERWRKQRKEFSCPVVTVQGKIVFHSNRHGEGGQTIYMLNNGRLKRLHGGLRPKISFDARKLISWGGLHGGLYFTDLSLGKETKIDIPKQYGLLADFDWSPDEKKICFVADSEENPVENLFIFDCKQKRSRKLRISKISTEILISVIQDGLQMEKVYCLMQIFILM